MTDRPLENLLGIEFSPSGDRPSNLGLGAALALPKHDTQTFAAFGKFITEYAAAEGALHMLMRHFSGMGEPRARAVLGGMRLPDLVKFVRALLDIDAHEESVKTDICECLDQINAISKVRHKLVHWTGTYDTDTATIKVHNAFTTRSQTETETISLPDLSAMTEDCISIFLRLYQLARPNGLKMAADTEAYSRLPWRYTPPQPTSPPKQPPKGRQGQPPRPDASPASRDLTASPPPPAPPENGQIRQPQSEPPNP